VFNVFDDSGKALLELIFGWVLVEFKVWVRHFVQKLCCLRIVFLFVVDTLFVRKRTGLMDFVKEIVVRRNWRVGLIDNPAGLDKVVKLPVSSMELFQDFIFRQFSPPYLAFRNIRQLDFLLWCWQVLLTCDLLFSMMLRRNDYIAFFGINWVKLFFLSLQLLIVLLLVPQVVDSFYWNLSRVKLHARNVIW
jgi:hypothetical protein